MGKVPSTISECLPSQKRARGAKLRKSQEVTTPNCRSFREAYEEQKLKTSCDLLVIASLFKVCAITIHQGTSVIDSEPRNVPLKMLTWNGRTAG